MLFRSSLSLQGPDLATLQRLNDALLPRLAAIPGVADLDTSMKPPKPTVSVEVRRESAADAGLSVAGITNALSALIAGAPAGQWRAGSDQTVDIQVRLDPTSRENLSDLSRLVISAGANPDGTSRVVRLNSLAGMSFLTSVILSSS